MALIVLCALILSISGCSKKNNNDNFYDSNKWDNLNGAPIVDGDPKEVGDPGEDGDPGEGGENDPEGEIVSVPNQSAFIEAVRGVDPNVEITEDNNCVVVTFPEIGWYCACYYFVYGNETDAKNEFDKIYKEAQTDSYDEVLDGIILTANNGNNGYVMFDGKGVLVGKQFITGQYYYGGCYYSDNVVLWVQLKESYQIKNSEKDYLDNICKALGLPALESR